MRSTAKIGAGQLFLFMVLSRVIITLTYSINSGDHVVNHADWLAALMLPVVLVILAIPTFWFLKRAGGVTVCEYAYTIGKPVGITVSVLYAALFFLMSFITMARFSFFVTSTTQNERGIFFFPILIVIPVLYAAIKGLPAIMRVSGLLTMISLITIAGIMAALIPRLDGLNLFTPLYDGWGNVGRSLLLLSSNSIGHVVLLMLAPNVRGNIKKAYAAFAVVAPLIIFLILFTTLLVLGSFSTLQMFPFYAAAGVAKLGELSNLSALEASVWIWGVFLRSSLHLYLCFQCLSGIIPRRFRGWTLFVLALLTVLCAALSSATVGSTQQNMYIPGSLATVIVFTMVLPALLIAVGTIRKRRNERLEQSGESAD